MGYYLANVFDDQPKLFGDRYYVPHPFDEWFEDHYLVGLRDSPDS